MKNNLRVIRKRWGMTLEEVGSVCGMSKGALCDLEHGRHTPRLDTARAIANAFDGINVDDIWPPKEGSSDE